MQLRSDFHLFINIFVIIFFFRYKEEAGRTSAELMQLRSDLASLSDRHDELAKTHQVFVCVCVCVSPPSTPMCVCVCVCVCGVPSTPMCVCVCVWVYIWVCKYTCIGAIEQQQLTNPPLW